MALPFDQDASIICQGSSGRAAIAQIVPAGGQGGLMYYGLKLLSERT